MAINKEQQPSFIVEVILPYGDDNTHIQENGIYGYLSRIETENEAMRILRRCGYPTNQRPQINVQLSPDVESVVWKISPQIDLR